jgi:hypothetical protein
MKMMVWTKSTITSFTAVPSQTRVPAFLEKILPLLIADSTKCGIVVIGFSGSNCWKKQVLAFQLKHLVILDIMMVRPEIKNHQNKN